MGRIPTHREPTHPGDMLLEEFLILMGITAGIGTFTHLNKAAQPSKGVTH